MGRNPFTQNGLLRTLSMSTCVQYAKKSLTNPSKQNAKPPIYLCQLPFICLWDMWIALPSLQNCNWKSSGVHWTSSFCSMNYTIRTRFSMPYMHTHYKTTPAAQHQESCIPNPVTTPIQNETPVQGAVSVTSPPPSPVTVSTVSTVY